MSATVSGHEQQIGTVWLALARVQLCFAMWPEQIWDPTIAIGAKDVGPCP